MSAQPEPPRGPAAVVVIGSYLVALVIEVERFPAVGETVNGGGYFETHGGKGSNMAVQAARLGARCAFAGRVGDDARGRSFRAMLTGEGVGTDHLHLQQGIATGVGFILLGPGGHNMIAIDSGANAQFSAADVDQAHSAMRPPATVLTQLEIPLATAMRGMLRGRDAGCTTILNPAPAQDLSAHDLASVSVITPNETEARVCLGMAPDERADEEALGRRLLERGCGAALLTLGERGCLCVTADGSEHVPASRSRRWSTPPAPATPSTPPWPWHWPRAARCPRRPVSPTPPPRYAAPRSPPCRPTAAARTWMRSWRNSDHEQDETRLFHARLSELALSDHRGAGARVWLRRLRDSRRDGGDGPAQGCRNCSPPAAPRPCAWRATPAWRS